MEENKKREFRKETEDLYEKETGKAIKVTDKLSGSVMRKAEAIKKKKRVTLWSIIAAVLVVVAVLVALLCAGAANKNKTGPGAVNDNHISQDGNGGAGESGDADGNPSYTDPDQAGTGNNGGQGGDMSGNSSGNGTSGGGSQSGNGATGDNNGAGDGQSSNGGSQSGDGSGSSQGGAADGGTGDNNGSSQGGSSGGTSDGDNGTGDSVGETGGEGNVDLSSQEKADEDLEDESLIERIGVKGLRILKVLTYKDGGAELNWYEFYNRCIDGTIDPHTDAARKYASDMLAAFKDCGMDAEVVQAENILNAK